MTAYTFNQIIDFTRTSAATYVANTGFVTQTPASRNLLTYTQEFDNAAWTKTNSQIVPNVNPAAASLGSELVTNGDFASGTGWTVAPGGTGSVTGGQAVITTSGAGSNVLLTQAVSLVAGRLYRVSYDVVSTNQQTSAYFTGGTTVVGAFQSGTGTRVVFLVAATGNTTLQIMGEGANATVTLDNVSLREVVGGALQAPDGTFTADTLVETSGSATRSVSRTYTSSAGSVYTLSVYAKNAGRRYLTLATGDGSAAMATFDLQNGVISGAAAVVGANWSTPFAQIEAVGNGWYRCSVTGVDVTGGSRTAFYTLNSTGANPGAGSGAAFSGDVNSGVFLWGAQLEVVADGSMVLESAIANNGVSLTGGAVDNGNGTYTIPPLGSIRFPFPLASLVNGAAYRVLFSNVAVSGSGGGSSVADLCDAANININIASGSSGPLSFVQARATYDSTFRFVDITAGTGFTLTVTPPTLQRFTGTVNYPTAYTRNVGGVYPPRFDYDPVTLAPRGLLIEEQRTNLFTYSQDFTNAAWDADGLTKTTGLTGGLDGTASVAEFSKTSAGSHYPRNTATNMAANTTYTISMWLWHTGTAPADVKFAYYSGAWNVSPSFTITTTPTRFTWTVTTGATAPTLGTGLYLSFGASGGAIRMWGAQLEAGAFATSYIPTVASQVTRTADQAVVTGANFSRWYNQSEGTLLVEYSRYQNVDFGVAAEIKPTSVNTPDRFDLLATSAADPRAQLFPGGSVALDSTSTFGVLAANTIVKAALAYRSGDSAATRNGASPFTSATTFSAPSYTNLQIGNSDNGIYGPAATNPLNGHIRRIRYYPTRLSNTQLQALTA